MAGDGGRRGAVRKAGSKKGPTRGSGGEGKKALRGRGPTPKAEDRVYHPAYKRKKMRESAPKRGGGKPGGPSRFTGAPVRPKRTPGTELIIGRNAVLEALEAGIPASSLYVAAGIESDDRVRNIIKVAGKARVEMLEASRSDLDQLTEKGVHQGLVLEVPPYEYSAVPDLIGTARKSKTAPLLVALDSITDPHNLGAVLRSAGAFGVHGVVIPERRSAGVNTTVYKVSAGAAARVPVARATNLTRALQDLRKSGYFIIGLDAGGTVELESLDLAEDPIVVVIGSEGKGLSRLVREQCDFITSIPISSVTESLNASVAGGIALYELARARGVVRKARY